MISTPDSLNLLAEPSVSICRIRPGANAGPLKKDELASKGIPSNLIIDNI